MSRTTKTLGAMLLVIGFLFVGWQAAQAKDLGTVPIKMGVSSCDSLVWTAKASTDSTDFAGYVAKNTRYFKTVSTGADTSQVIDGRNAHLRNVLWLFNNHGGGASTGTIKIALYLQGTVGNPGVTRADSLWKDIYLIDSVYTETTPQRKQIRYRPQFAASARDTAASVYPLLRFQVRSYATSVDTTRGVVIPYIEYPPIRDQMFR